MLEVTQLEAGYGQHQVLKGLSMQVRPGQIVTLLGGNGAGKTTTLNSIMGLLAGKGGSVSFEGQAIRGKAAHKVFSHGIVLVPQWRELFPDMSVREHLEIGAIKSAKRSELAGRVETALEYLPELRPHLGRRAGTLSGGQQQMVAIGRALTSRPKLLMLDEPTMGLAPMVVQSLGAIIRKLNGAGTSVLLVEQNVQLALSVAHYVYIIRGGTIVKHGSPDAFQDQEELFQSYIG